MDIQQFHREFKITLDKLDSQAYPEFLPAEIDYYLNEAQDRFIKQRYGGNNIYRAGYEEIQKRTDDLKALVISNYANLSSVSYYQETGLNVFRADLSSLFTDVAKENESTSEYMLFIKASARTCLNNCCSWSKVKLVQQDDLTTISEDPFNRPKLDKPIIFFEDSDIFVWTQAGASISDFLVTFIRKPLQMSLSGGVTSELSDHTHKEIVQMAVRIALENIESPRQQSQEILNVQKSE